MSNLITTSGRSTRSEYFSFSFLGYITLSILRPFMKSNTMNMWYLGLVIIVLVINICLKVQRLHDLNRSGYHYFLTLIPIYNIYMHLILTFKKGTDGPNEYGEDPLGIKEIA